MRNEYCICAYSDQAFRVVTKASEPIDLAMDDIIPHIQGQRSQGVTLQQEISSLRTTINRFESGLDDKFNAFQANFLADAKLLLEKAFGKSIDFPVAISQGCKGSDESSLVTGFAEPTDQVSTMEASTVVELSDSLLELPLVQGVGVVSTELAAMEHEQLLTDSNEVEVFDEFPVITDVESDNFDYSISGLLEVPHDKGFDILDSGLLEQSPIHDILLGALMAMKVIGPGETGMLDERPSDIEIEQATKIFVIYLEASNPWTPKELFVLESLFFKVGKCCALIVIGNLATLMNDDRFDSGNNDIKYRFRTSDVQPNIGKKRIQLSFAEKLSQLEVVNLVAVGKIRTQQCYSRDVDNDRKQASQVWILKGNELFFQLHEVGATISDANKLRWQLVLEDLDGEAMSKKKISCDAVLENHFADTILNAQQTPVLAHCHMVMNCEVYFNVRSGWHEYQAVIPWRLVNDIYHQVHISLPFFVGFALNEAWLDHIIEAPEITQCSSELFAIDYLSSVDNCVKESTYCQPPIHSLWFFLIDTLLSDIVLQTKDAASNSRPLRNHISGWKSSSYEEEIVKNIQWFHEAVFKGSILEAVMTNVSYSNRDMKEPSPLHTTTIVKKFHHLGMFDSIATLAVAQSSHKEIIVCEDTDQVCGGMEIAAIVCVSLQFSHIMGNALEEEFYEQKELWSLEDFSYLILILRQVSWQLLRVNSSAHLSFRNQAPTLPLMSRHQLILEVKDFF
ncbi:hypothetical protein GQ457_01G021340 [Hibiscus cannabinus]